MAKPHPGDKRPEFMAILLPRFVHMLVLASAQAQRWDILEGVHALVAEVSGMDGLCSCALIDLFHA